MRSALQPHAQAPELCAALAARAAAAEKELAAMAARIEQERAAAAEARGVTRSTSKYIDTFVVAAALSESPQREQQHTAAAARAQTGFQACALRAVRDGQAW